MPKYEFSLLLSSNPEAGATNISQNGSTFFVFLDDPIQIPSNAFNVKLSVKKATVWFNEPNVSSDLGNNKLYLKYNAVDYVITIPDGLYSLTDLNSTIDREIESATGDSGILSLEADEATSKVNIAIKVANVQLDFTQADTIRDIIGFDSQLVPTPNPSTGVYNQLADNPAAFNAVEYFLIHCDLVDKGILIGSSYKQVIAQVLVNVGVGEQIQYQPFQPDVSPAWNLIGQIKNSIKVWLTDDSGNLVNTNDEYYSAMIAISYEVP